jgi:hypothetical protein
LLLAKDYEISLSLLIQIDETDDGCLRAIHGLYSIEAMAMLARLCLGVHCELHVYVFLSQIMYMEQVSRTKTIKMSVAPV